MIAEIYRLRFIAEVHFGEGMLDASAWTFHADTLFSALCLEALKAGSFDELLRLANSGALLLSDAFPYDRGGFYVPKPMDRPELPAGQQQDVKQRKKFKKLAFVRADLLSDYLKGRLDFAKNRTVFGANTTHSKVNVRSGEEDPRPYRIGSFRFDEENGCGLYVIALAENNEALKLANSLFEALSYSGIGGKRTAGFGRFTLDKCDPAKVCPILAQHLRAPAQCQDGKRQMLLSTALPDDAGLEQALDGACYLLEQRSGFVAPEESAESLKKKDLYVFKAGSCFAHPFAGTIRDVSKGTPHPVYRYARSLYWEM